MSTWGLETEIFKAIGDNQAVGEQLSNRLDPLRGMLAKSLAVNGVFPDIGAVSTPTCSTTIRAGLLKGWAHDARDPGETLCSWLTGVAPAGLTVGFE